MPQKLNIKMSHGTLFLCIMDTEFAKIGQLCRETESETSIERMNQLHRTIWSLGLKRHGRSASVVFGKGAYAIYKNAKGDKAKPTLAVTQTLSKLIQTLVDDMRQEHYPESSTVQYGIPITFCGNSNGTAYANVDLGEYITVDQEPICCTAKLIMWAKDGVKFRFIDVRPCYNETDLEAAYKPTERNDLTVNATLDQKDRLF